MLQVCSLKADIPTSFFAQTQPHQQVMLEEHNKEQNYGQCAAASGTCAFIFRSGDFSLLVVSIRGARGCLKIMIFPPACRKGFLERKLASQATSSCYYTVYLKRKTQYPAVVLSLLLKRHKQNKQQLKQKSPKKRKKRERKRETLVNNKKPKQ